MKLSIVHFLLITICAGTIESSMPGNNSDYVEGVSRWIWMPDGNNTPHLVDLQSPELENLEPLNGASNQYWLFTRQNPTIRQLLINKDIQSVRDSNYQTKLPLYVIVHGWNNKGSSSMNPLITSAILAVMDANVIVVDWSRVASGTYSTSVRRVPDVGRQLGLFLEWLIEKVGGDWNNVHLIGFSLGAHVVGSAGRTVGGRPARITGLDPAGPQWRGNPNALNRNDGIYVEAIHTDGEILGIPDPIADADFYPNGGRNPQPNCLLSTCSHSRAPLLFASSIRTNHFLGRECLNLTEAKNNQCTGMTLNMGNGIFTKRGRGLYGLTTGGKWPF